MTLRWLATIALFIVAGMARAQSVDIPSVTVAKGDTANVVLVYLSGGGATNFDFTLEYDPAVVDESAITVNCNPVNVGLTSLTCAIDLVNNQVKGIGVNLPLTGLASGSFVSIGLPVRGDAADGASVNPYIGHFATPASVSPLDTNWTLIVKTSHCNVTVVSGVADMANAMYEACEILVVGPDYVAEDGASVMLSSGWEIHFAPGFLIMQGATLDAQVCGQSLCMTSPLPMPAGCHSCVVQICDIDPACCDTAFDQSCVDKVNSVCNLACE